MTHLKRLVPLLTAGGPFRLVLAVTSAVVLAWHFDAALPDIALTDSPPRSYTATTEPSARNPASLGEEVWLTAVTVDGRVVPFEMLELNGSWENLGFALAHRNGAEPASVRQVGRYVVFCFMANPWSGSVQLASDGVPMQSLDLFRDAVDGTNDRCVEVAGGRVVSTTGGSSWISLGLIWALLPILALLLIWRPWRTSRSLESWVVAQLIALHALAWFVMGIGSNNDAPGYLEGVRLLARGESNYFPPGYALFLSPWTLLVPDWTGFLATAAQHVCMVLSLLWLRRIAVSFLGEDLATLGLLVAGSAAPTLFLPQMILSENVALVGMAGSLWFASRSEQSRTVLQDVTSGLFAGMAGLARVVPLAAIAVPIFLIQYSPVDRRSSIMRSARVLSVAASIILLFASWNLVRGGSFSISTGADLHLYNRVVTEQALIDLDAPQTVRLMTLVDERPLAGVPHWEVVEVLAARGLSWGEASQLMGAVALAGIQRDPLAFELYTLRLAWREYRAVPTLEPWDTGEQPIASLESPVSAGWRSSSIAWWRRAEHNFASMWPLLLWMPLAGLLLLPLLQSRTAFLAILAVPFGYLFATAHVEYFLARYVAAVLPFALVLAPAPFAALGRGWALVRRRQRMR